MNQGEGSLESIGDRGDSFSTTGIGRDDDALGNVVVKSNPTEHAGLGIEVVDGDVKEALNLRSVQIHSDDMVAASGLEHVGHELGGDGSARLVLLVLTGVREVRDDGSDAASRGCLASVDHNEELHNAIVDVVGLCGLEDEDCIVFSQRSR